MPEKCLDFVEGLFRDLKARAFRVPEGWRFDVLPLPTDVLLKCFGLGRPERVQYTIDIRTRHDFALFDEGNPALVEVGFLGQFDATKLSRRAD